MELIKITEQNGKQAVSARELHAFLVKDAKGGQTGEDFSNWITRMLDYVGAEQNIDYEVFEFDYQGNPIAKFSESDNQSVRVHKREYALNIDLAKEISVIQNNNKGKQARKYFIECEKKLKNPLQNISRLDLARMVIQAEEENQRLQIEAKENAHKVLFTDAVIGSNSSCLIGDLAKFISQNGYTRGQNRLFQWLRDHEYLGRKGERRNIPNQQYIEQGLFEIKKGVRTGKDGVLHQTTTPKVTGKGQVYFVNKFLKQL